MSIKLMTIVWELDLPPGEKLVLLALADQANDAGVNCWPSVRTIAKRSGQSARTVQRAVVSLGAKGHLTSHTRSGTSTQYHVHPRHDVTSDKLSPVTKATATPDMVSPKPSRTGTPQKAAPSSGMRPTTVPTNFSPQMKAGSITAKAVAGWPPGLLAEQIEHFIDRHTAQGTTSKCWQASWRTWVKHWKSFNGNRPSSTGYRDPILGDAFDELHSRVGQSQ